MPGGRSGIVCPQGANCPAFARGPSFQRDDANRRGEPTDDYFETERIDVNWNCGLEGETFGKALGFRSALEVIL
jgi:hypothetical protein